MHSTYTVPSLMKEKIGPDFTWNYTLAIIYRCTLFHLGSRINSDEYFLMGITQ